MAAGSHTTYRKHQHQPNTQRPRWGPDPPHGHFTHAPPPPLANKTRVQASKAGPGGLDSTLPMGGRPYPSARLPELGPNGASGPARVAAAAPPHGGSEAHNAEAA